MNYVTLTRHKKIKILQNECTYLYINEKKVLWF